mmetsp:Transcript_8170/g.21023  ORF Transcript_8170/g.21023 Transcript_8170/m.21023 type:complete len:236 (+) Transcript_8170:1003-1710(+)
MFFALSMLAEAPSTPLETISSAPLNGFAATPMTPLATPFIKPFAPPWRAPSNGLVKKPDTPEAIPLARDSPPTTNPSVKLSTRADFSRDLPNWESKERIAAAPATLDSAPVATEETDIPVNSIGRICIAISCRIFPCSSSKNMDLFSVTFLSSHFLMMLTDMSSILAKDSPNLLMLSKSSGLESGLMRKLMCALMPDTESKPICISGSTKVSEEVSNFPKLNFFKNFTKTQTNFS